MRSFGMWGPKSRSSPAVVDHRSKRAGVSPGSSSAGTRTAHRHTASSHFPSHLPAAAASSLDTQLAQVQAARPGCKRKPLVVVRRLAGLLEWVGRHSFAKILRFQLEEESGCLWLSARAVARPDSYCLCALPECPRKGRTRTVRRGDRVGLGP